MEKKKFSIHHLVPRSRIPEEYIQKLNPINTKRKENDIHETWHQLFSNFSPFEILVLLVAVIYPEDFISAEIVVKWEDLFFDSFVLEEDKKNITRIIFSKKKIFLLRTIFGKKITPLEIVERIIEDWSPVDYFFFVDIVDIRMDRVTHYSSKYPQHQNII